MENDTSDLELLQLVEVIDGSLSLNTQVLDHICKQIPDETPIAIIATIGRFRQGKTFWSNCLLHRLQSGKVYFELEDTVGGKGGIPFKSGYNGHTQGIMIWPQVFTERDDEGNPLMAKLLLDVQGTFDQAYDRSITTKLVAISSLISSTLILNAHRQIDLSDLEELKLNIEFCNQFQKLQGENQKGVGQQLVFLIRDSCSKVFGIDETYLDILRSQVRGNPAGLGLVEGILNGYQRVDTYQIPHPEGKVIQADQEIKAKDCGEGFLRHLCETADHISRTVQPKEMAGSPLRGNELKSALMALVQHFQSNEISVPGMNEALYQFFADKNEKGSLRVFQDRLRMLSIRNGDRGIDPLLLEHELRNISDETIQLFTSSRLFAFGTDEQREIQHRQFCTILEEQCRERNEKNARELEREQEELRKEEEARARLREEQERQNLRDVAIGMGLGAVVVGAFLAPVATIRFLRGVLGGVL